jgi:hypothetical protein
MAVKVVMGLPLTCEEDGHDIVVRPRWDIERVELRMSCARCGLMMLPCPSFNGRDADWLMKQVQAAAFTPEVPPEAYEQLFQEPKRGLEREGWDIPPEAA